MPHHMQREWEQSRIKNKPLAKIKRTVSYFSQTRAF